MDASDRLFELNECLELESGVTKNRDWNERGLNRDSCFSVSKKMDDISQNCYHRFLSRMHYEHKW